MIERLASCRGKLVAPIVASVWLLAGPVLHAQSGENRVSRNTVPSEIRGTLRLNGCTPDPAVLALRADAMSFGLARSRRDISDPRAAEKVARFRRTADPHLLEFSIRGLQPGALYRLAVSFPPSPCGRVFWRGPFGGLATSGGADVTLEGFAARTQVEIQDSEGDWVGADQLDFTDAREAVRNLRWKSDLPGLSGAELQVSTEPYPLSGRFSPCGEPAGGIVFRESLSARNTRGDWQEIAPVDFSRILIPADSRTDSTPGGPAVAREVGTGVTRTAWRRLLSGAPVYIRVVPAVAGGRPACDVADDGVHGWVVLAKLPISARPLPAPPEVPPLLDAGNGQEYIPPYLPEGEAKGHPLYNEQAYVVIKNHTLPPACVGSKNFLWAFDPLGCSLVDGGIAAGTQLTTGDWVWLFTWTTHSGSGNPLSQFLNVVGGSLVSLATGTFKAVGLGVDAAAQVWSDAQEAVAQFVTETLESLPVLGEFCDAINDSDVTSCKSLVKTGLTTAIAMTGMPPTIPNWGLVQQGGVELLASEIAEEVAAESGGVIPAELTEEVLKEMAQKAIAEISAKRGIANGPQYDWVLPYAGFDPASWLVTIKKTSTGDVPAGLRLVTNKTPLYLGGDIPLSRWFPSSGVMRIPMALPPNLAGIKPPKCITDMFGSVTCKPNSFISKPLCVQEFGGNPGVYHPWDCALTNHVQVYYRDVWANLIFPTSQCIDLQSTTVQVVSGSGTSIVLPAPDPPFLVLGLVHPPAAAKWNGPFYAAPACAK